AIISCAPKLDQDKSEKHTAQVGKMSRIISRPVGNTRKEFNGAVSDYKILGFNGHRKEQEHEPHIGKHHSKGEQNAKYGSRSTYDRYVVKRIEFAPKRIRIIFTFQPKLNTLRFYNFQSLRA